MKHYVTALAAVASMLGGCGIQYSTSARYGVVYKFSEKGRWTNSGEGTLTTAALRGNAQSGISNTWNFSATDPQVIAKLVAAQEAQHPVVVKYSQLFLRNPFKTDTAYIVTDVVVAK